MINYGTILESLGDLNASTYRGLHSTDGRTSLASSSIREIAHFFIPQLLSRNLLSDAGIHTSHAQQGSEFEPLLSDLKDLGKPQVAILQLGKVLCRSLNVASLSGNSQVVVLSRSVSLTPRSS